MHIMLNDSIVQLRTHSTVAELLQLQQLATTGLAVAVNNNVIAKGHWSEYQLQHLDNVQLFHIVTGG